jgi:hypothetical protein
MSRFLGFLTVLTVLLLAMGFAAANAGNRVTVGLGLFTLYQVPVTLVAFSGLFVGMVVMFLTGIHTDLKVRRILKDRLAEESRQEMTAIDRSQQDLFGEDRIAGEGEGSPPVPAGGGEAGSWGPEGEGDRPEDVEPDAAGLRPEAVGPDGEGPRPETVGPEEEGGWNPRNPE